MTDDFDWPFAYRVAADRSLLGVTVRPPKEEICDHCGATYTGLFHCQSLSQIKEIDDSEFIGVISEWTPRRGRGADNPAGLPPRRLLAR